MRTILLSSCLVAAVPFGAAAQEGTLDPTLLTCMGHFDYLANIWEDDLEQQEVSSPDTIRLIQQLSANWEAFSYLIGTRDQCQTSLAAFREQSTQSTVAVFAEEERRLAAGESYDVIYNDIWDRAVACTQEVGTDALTEASRAVQTQGPPCGWGAQ